MKLRALLIGTALAAAWAGCGLTAVGTYESAPGAGVDAGTDVARANLPEASGFDATELPVPAAGTTEFPIGADDAGADADADASLEGGADAAVAPPFEIVAPAGGKYRVLDPKDTLPCSTGGTVDAKFDLKNLSAQAVRLRWVAYNCFEAGYGTVSVGNGKSQPTYVGHRWRIKNDVDATTLVDFVIDAPGTYTVIVR